MSCEGPLATVVYVGKKQHDQTITEAWRAVALDPNNANNHPTLGNILVFAGQTEEAVALVKQAMYSIEALSIAWRDGMRKRRLLEKILALTPSSEPAHFNLAIIYSELGRMEKAQTEVAELLRFNPNASLETSRDIPFKDPVLLERHIAALRKAGLK